MAVPVLIDTDMGVDDAVAIALAASCAQLDIVGLASVEGNVSLEQATANVARLMVALDRYPSTPIGRGLSQESSRLKDAAHVFGADGLGEVDLPGPADFSPVAYLDLYEQLIETHGSELAIVAIGPLTNLAGVLRARPGLLQRAGRIVVMGGAIWCKGNINEYAEFNFYRDSRAAAEVLDAGLPITVVPLDVTRQVAMDESHVAHLSRGGTRAGELLTAMIRFPLSRATDAPPGTFLVHDALAVGVLIWPELFMRARMALNVTVSGKEAGRVRPRVSKDRQRQASVVMSVNVGDFLDNLLEQICHEKFVV